MRLLLIGIAALSMSNGWAEPMSLDQAIEIGLENSHQLKAAESRVRQAKQQSRQALGLLGFRFDAQADYERYLPEQTFGPGAPGQPDAKRVTGILSYVVDVVGLNRKAAAAARANEDSVQAALEAERVQVRARIRSAYIQASRAQEAVEVRQVALETNKAILDNLKSRFAVGDIPKFDVLRLETEVVRAETSLTEAKNLAQLTLQALNNAMNRKIDEPIELATLPEMQSVPAETDWVAEAKSTRFELKQLQKLLMAQEFFTYTERGGQTPTLTLSAVNTLAIDPSPFQNENQTTLQASLRIPLFDSGITKARVRAARESEEQTRQQIKSTELSIELEVRNALTSLRNSEQLIQIALKTVELQTEALRLARLRYENQVGILIDVTQAQNDLTLARFQLVSARAEYRLAFAALQQAIGRDNLQPTPEQ